MKEEPRTPVQAVPHNLDDGMSPNYVAKAYQIELRLVTGVKQVAESRRLRILFDKIGQYPLPNPRDKRLFFDQ